jgi:class 3 adenylate cyclase
MGRSSAFRIQPRVGRDRGHVVPQLPTGTITFLASDLGDGPGAGRRPARQERALARRHAALLGDAIAAQGGVRLRETGGTLYAAFPMASDALAVATDARRAVSAEPSAAELAARLRIALHTGETPVQAGRYVTTPLKRVARLLGAAYGGQVLLSATTAELVRHQLPAGVDLRDLGEHRFSDLEPPGQIFQLNVAELPIDFPPIKTLDWHPHNLPGQLTSLIGRERDVTAVDHLLRRHDVRLVTLTGPGGIGKTRLAQHIAASVVDAYDDGVFLVSLAAIDDPVFVLSTIAQTLDLAVPEGQEPRAALFGYLADRQMLLVLDNFEHVIEAATDVVALLAACPRVKVLATSREVLNARGERGYAVPPMTLPDPGQALSLDRLSDYDAVRLFIVRAIEANPRFAVPNGVGSTVVDICRRLDGLPLPIELAADRGGARKPHHRTRFQHRLTAQVLSPFPGSLRSLWNRS